MKPAIKRPFVREDPRARDSHGKIGNPGFLSRALSERPEGGVESLAAHRRARGLCPDCARPLRVAQFDETGAVLTCRCGWQNVAPPGSGLYKRARDMRAQEAASR